jgi:hypothetical protein
MRSTRFWLTAFFVIFNPAITTSAGEEVTRQFTFTWPYADASEMAPRGGSSKGPEINLDPKPGLAWASLREKDLIKFERDRRAILAMQGPFRASFDFLEVAGFKSGFSPNAPYQSWGTEYVYLIEDGGHFISLQHILVIFIKKVDGTLTDPIVVKHWRQDWRYEDQELTVFNGFNSWKLERLTKKSSKGSWTQAVFQVDDSPRYEAQGKWTHKKNYSQWQSDETWRPLPRREFSVRDDYHALIGKNRHTITPTGWTHQEDNLKVVLAKPGVIANDGILAQELGFNRYERIIGHDFTEGDAYWAETQNFWSEVRRAWEEVIHEKGAFTLASEVDGQPMFSAMFGYATQIREQGSYDAETARQYVRKTIERFIRKN